MVVIYKNEGGSSLKASGRPVLGFRDSEKVRGILSKLLPLVITIIIGQFDVFQILIDDGSSCDIIYSSLFEKMVLDGGNMIPYDDPELHAFNGMTTRPLDTFK